MASGEALEICMWPGDTSTHCVPGSWGTHNYLIRDITSSCESSNRVLVVSQGRGKSEASRKSVMGAFKPEKTKEPPQEAEQDMDEVGPRLGGEAAWKLRAEISKQAEVVKPPRS